MGVSADPARRNLVLTGFMGTGKTTVGRLVADALDLEFVDTDDMIERRYGPIPQIFAEHGEGRFRAHERDVAAELSGRAGLVVATGGRMMVDAVNAEQLGSSGDVVCLTASVDTIVARVATVDDRAVRPMLAGSDGDVRARVAELLDERRSAYERFRQVDTDGRSPAEVAAAIVAIRSGG